MRNSLCLLLDNSTGGSHVHSILSACGMEVWIATSVESCLSDKRSRDLLCLIVDAPIARAEAFLETLRAAKVRSPALLITNRDEARLRRNADWLDVLERPASIRTILGWVECVCAAQLALERARSLRRNFFKAA